MCFAQPFSVIIQVSAPCFFVLGSALFSATCAASLPEGKQAGGKHEKMVLLSFDGPSVPLNKAGDGFPSFYFDPSGRKEGGKFTASIRDIGAVAEKCLELKLTEGSLYAQFSPYDKVTRGFARDYTVDPAAWKYNTYNRMRFWIQAPPSAPAHLLTGQSNTQVGTYVKRIDRPDVYSDETGGGHFYHHVNIPGVGNWTQVLINMHPNYLRGEAVQKELGNQPHPTRESECNYFDALTRFYIQSLKPPARYPATYLLDKFEFFREPHEENDQQVYSLTATYVASKQRVILTWNRDKNENKTKHEVRYAFKEIHSIGWKAANPAPRGILKPLGEQAYNGMVYDCAGLPLAGKNVVYFAVKPENSNLFSQIAIPLSLP